MRQNASAHASAHQCPHLGQPLRKPHNQQIGPSGLLGSNPNPRLAVEGPLPRGLAPTRRGLGTPEHQRRTHPAALPRPGTLGSPSSFRVGELAGTSVPPATFEGNPRQNARAHAPAHHCTHLGPTLRSPHSLQIGPASLLGANPNPSSAPEEPLPRDWRRHAGDWGQSSPSAGLSLPPHHHPGC